jgi:hypothetical protein
MHMLASLPILFLLILLLFVVALLFFRAITSKGMRTLGVPNAWIFSALGLTITVGTVWVFIKYSTLL